MKSRSKEPWGKAAAIDGLARLNWTEQARADLERVYNLLPADLSMSNMTTFTARHGLKVEPSYWREFRWQALTRRMREANNSPGRQPDRKASWPTR